MYRVTSTLLNITIYKRIEHFQWLFSVVFSFTDFCRDREESRHYALHVLFAKNQTENYQVSMRQLQYPENYKNQIDNSKYME